MCRPICAFGGSYVRFVYIAGMHVLYLKICQIARWALRRDPIYEQLEIFLLGKIGVPLKGRLGHDL